MVWMLESDAESVDEFKALPEISFDDLFLLLMHHARTSSYSPLPFYSISFYA